MSLRERRRAEAERWQAIYRRRAGAIGIELFVDAWRTLRPHWLFRCRATTEVLLEWWPVSQYYVRGDGQEGLADGPGEACDLAEEWHDTCCPREEIS